jgi:hypothetical protein
MTRDSAEGFTVLLAVGVGGWLIYQVYQSLKAAGAQVGAATQAAGNAIGGSIYNAFNPGAAGATVTHIATATDTGQKVAVNNNSLDYNNVFSVPGGGTYQLQQTPQGNLAVPVDPNVPDSLSADFSAGNF